MSNSETVIDQTIHEEDHQRLDHLHCQILYIT